MQNAVKLIGREPEIERLDNILVSGQAEFLAVYGRRRVGKTFLIRQYLKDHIVFDFTGTKDGAKEEQLQNFYAEFKRWFFQLRQKIVGEISWCLIYFIYQYYRAKA